MGALDGNVALGAKPLVKKSSFRQAEHTAVLFRILLRADLQEVTFEMTAVDEQRTRNLISDPTSLTDTRSFAYVAERVIRISCG